MVCDFSCRLSTSLVRVLMDGSFCDCGEVVSHGRRAAEVSMISVRNATEVERGYEVTRMI